MTDEHNWRVRQYRLAAIILIANALAVSQPPPALAQWAITLVADEVTTGIEIGGEAPSISGQEIAFFGDANTKLFKVGPSGVPVTLFQAGGPVPGAAGSNFFQIFEAYSFGGQTFAFRGSSTTTMPTQFGAYAVTNTGPIALAGLGSSPALPEGAGSFLGVDGNDVAFGGPTSIRVLRAGVVQLIADTSTQMAGAPPGTNFASFSAMHFDNGTVVFSGSKFLFPFRTGIYYDRNDGTGIHKLVDNFDTAPGGAALFSTFLTTSDRLAISGNDVVFYAEVADGRIGIFICRNFGPPEIITAYNPAAPTVILPPFTERADTVQGLSVSNGEVAFLARSPGNVTGAIFATRGAGTVIERVIGTGAILGGRTVDVPIGRREMRNGNTIAFNVLFVEHPLDLGIYRADRCSTGTPPSALQNLINAATPGSAITISVSGTCTDNLLVRNEKQRITIDGGGAGPGTRATIVGDPSAPVFNVRGKGILIKNFNIQGGSHGIHVNRGSNAVLDNNVIENTGGNGVLVDELAYGVLTNNTIRNNPGAGVFVGENSTARVGFNADSDSVAAANAIQNNGVGVVVSNNSSARVIGNTIQNHSGVGIQVLRDSHADVASNTISNNADGIEVGENSLVQLGEDSGASIYESPNSGTNTGFGIKCNVGGVADGRIGTLSGVGGAKNFGDPGCIDSLN